MEYVDGGGVGENWWNSTEWVGRYVDIIIIAVSGGTSIGGMIVEGMDRVDGRNYGYVFA
jgi:hypothetical protein